MSFLFHKNTKKALNWIWSVLAIMIALSMIVAYSGGFGASGSSVPATQDIPSDITTPTNSNTVSGDNITIPSDVAATPDDATVLPSDADTQTTNTATTDTAQEATPITPSFTTEGSAAVQ